MSTAAPAKKSILLGTERRETQPAATRGSVAAAWKAVGWFGFALAVIGLGQIALNFFPVTGFGSPEWEFGTMAQVVGALPLPTMGLAALLAAAYASGSRRGLIALAVSLVLLTVLVGGALFVFWTVVPMALRAVPDIAAAPIQQTVAKTTLIGAGFALLYIAAAISALRHLTRSARRPDHA